MRYEKSEASLELFPEAKAQTRLQPNLQKWTQSAANHQAQRDLKPKVSCPPLHTGIQEYRVTTH